MSEKEPIKQELLTDLTWDLTKDEFVKKLNTALDYGREQHLIMSLPITADTVGIITFFRIFTCHHCGHCCKEPLYNLDEKLAFIYFPIETVNIIRDKLPKNYLDHMERYKHEFRDKSSGKLLHTANGYKMKFPCLFWDKENNRCNIYNHRPAVCKQFPLNPNSNNPKTLNVAMECPGAYETAKKSWLMAYERYGKEGLIKDVKNNINPPSS